MRVSRYLFSTLKETPIYAQVVSYQLICQNINRKIGDIK